MWLEESVFSAIDLRHLPWGTQATARTDPSKAICPTAQTMNLTPSYAAMVQSRAAKLFPHNLLRRKRYEATNLALNKVS